MIHAVRDVVNTSRLASAVPVHGILVGVLSEVGVGGSGTAVTWRPIAVEEGIEELEDGLLRAVGAAP